MTCSECGRTSVDAARYCRGCGRAFEGEGVARRGAADLARTAPPTQAGASPGADADDLVASGIGKVFAADGFFMVAVLLAGVPSEIASALWLLLLIPAFYLFGLGFADVFKARQIRRRQKDERRLAGADEPRLLSPPVSIAEMFTRETTRRLRHDSGNLRQK
jgi:hypothetical protein